MAVEVEIDVEVLKSEIKKTYASVSQEPEKDFIFPTGRPWAEDLGYPAELASVPETAVGSFAGVANPWQLGRLAPGERVLDLGSGSDGLEPSTPPYHGGFGSVLAYNAAHLRPRSPCKSNDESVSLVAAHARACTI
jgi:hypothetical protein